MAKTLWEADLKVVKALVLTGYGLNCDYETSYSLMVAGAEVKRAHINEVIDSGTANKSYLDGYQILVFGGGFGWADDHGAGVILATRLKYNICESLLHFVDSGNLVMGHLAKEG